MINMDTTKITICFEKMHWDKVPTDVSFRINKKPAYELEKEVEIPSDWLEKKHLHAVSIIYDTGDSFGHYPETGFIIVGVYDSWDDAQKIKEEILNDYKNNRDPGYEEDSYYLILSHGTKIFTDYKGYFESLNRVQITSGTIRKD